MTMSDPLLSRLAELGAAPLRPLVGRVYASVTTVDTDLPMGPVFVASSERGINYVQPASHMGPVEPLAAFVAEYEDRFSQPARVVPAPRVVREAVRSGRTAGLDYDLRGVTGFEQSVLRKALEIPRGETRPYNWIAAEIGRPRAVRAVGSALGRNPIPFLIPCHRVVRNDGSEGQYGFGTDLKRSLLRAEQVNLDEIHDLAARGSHFVGSDTTKVVCYPSCHDARRITPAHLVEFRTLEQAALAGYRPCRRCRPPAAAPAA